MTSPFSPGSCEDVAWIRVKTLEPGGLSAKFQPYLWDGTQYTEKVIPAANRPEVFKAYAPSLEVDTDYQARWNVEARRWEINPSGGSEFKQAGRLAAPVSTGPTGTITQMQVMPWNPAGAALQGEVELITNGFKLVKAGMYFAHAWVEAGITTSTTDVKYGSEFDVTNGSAFGGSSENFYRHTESRPFLGASGIISSTGNSELKFKIRATGGVSISDTWLPFTNGLFFVFGINSGVWN